MWNIKKAFVKAGTPGHIYFFSFFLNLFVKMEECLSLFSTIIQNQAELIHYFCIKIILSVQASDWLINQKQETKLYIF